MDSTQASRYRSLDFFARQAVEGFISGRHRSPLHGFSVEFSDYRQYYPGESTAHIDWRLYGRTDRLYVKQFEEETNLRCQLVVDQSSSMLFPIERHGSVDRPNKLTFAAYAAAVLVELLYRQHDAFGLSLLSNGIDQQTLCRSNSVHRRHVLSLLDTLLQPVDTAARPVRSTAIAEALHLTAEQLHRRSLVVIFTDALDDTGTQEPLLDALRHLRHNKHEVILFHTFDGRLERDFDFGTSPHKFIDLESGTTVRLTPSQVADTYRQAMASRHNELKQRAMQYRIDYVPVDINSGFHPVMLPFLLKRSKTNA